MLSFQDVTRSRTTTPPTPNPSVGTVGGFQASGSRPQRLVACSATLKGYKQRSPECPNQDSKLVMDLGSGRLLAAIFDGHGQNGHVVSNRGREVFEQHAQRLAAASPQDMGRVLAAGFADAQQVVMRENLAMLSGSTATVALIDIVAKRATVASVGDSKLVVATAEGVAFETSDHRIDDTSAATIAKHGGEVRVVDGAKRIFLRGEDFPGLAMSRSLGDAEAASVGLSSVPDVQEVPLAPGWVVVLASDGVWDMLSAKAVAAGLFSPSKPPNEELAGALVGEARRRWDVHPTATHVDDITAVVVCQAADTDGDVPSGIC